MGGQKVTVPAGRLTVFWAGIPHQIMEFEGLADYFVLTIPLAWFLQWRLPDHLTQPILHGQMIIEPDEGRLLSDWARFEAWCEDVRMGTEEYRHVSLLEIEARLRRLALTVVDSPQRRLALQLCDRCLPTRVRHHVAQVRHAAPVVPHPATAGHHRGFDPEHRLEIGLQLAQPFQRGVPASLRLHPARIP